MKTVYALFIVLLLHTSLWGETGIKQSHLLNISPDTDSESVSPTASFAFTFDRPIIRDSIDENTVHLQHRQQKIKGNAGIREENTLLFSPAQPLQKGVYEIEVNPLKLKKENTSETEPKGTWQEFIAWLCGLVYDDINACPLCQYVCNVQSNIRTEPIRYTFEVKEEAPKVTSISASRTLIELSEHNSTQLVITATYDDNSSEEITQKASYASSDSSVADIEKGLVSTFKEGSAAIQVSYGDKSINIQVEVYELIEGHLLPHEPENPDATLLGVDENNNGVRDEVERWIYKEMPTYHHPEIERVIAMQSAKASQMALKDPTNKEDEVHKAIDRASECWFYYAKSKDIPFDGAVEKFNALLDDKQFNTKERLKTYLDYDYTLKGRVFFDTPSRLLNTSYCDQNIDVMP